MNGVDAIIKSFGRGIDKLINTVGNWGSASPVDDSKSGIKIGDNVYQVVVSLNGCYWYLDDNGRKKPVAQIPETTEWSWMNINEKVLKDFRTCYRTLGGKVEVWSWYLLNDQMDVLKETHRITDSTDMDNPTGKILESIPKEWRTIDCDLPDMTERDITIVGGCYRTPGGKVEIEGLESIDDKITVRESIYKIIQSTDDNFPAEHEFNVIPAAWVRIVCDFPDMTERDILYINECYVTPGGKIHVGGYRTVDAVMGIRGEYMIVMETTDPAIPRGTTYTVMPDSFNKVVCDFPDATTADTEIVENCYKTDSGKVQLRTYLTIDGYGDIRSSRHMVMKSTDPKYNTGSPISDIPDVWLNIECDFASATQRHMKDINECYESVAGKVYVEGYRVFDNDLGVERTELTVLQSTDPAVLSGSIWFSIPNGFTKTLCNCNCF